MSLRPPNPSHSVCPPPPSPSAIPKDLRRGRLPTVVGERHLHDGAGLVDIRNVPAACAYIHTPARPSACERVRQASASASGHQGSSRV